MKNNKDNKYKGKGNGRNKRRYNNKSRSDKEFEINVKDDSINKADLKNVIGKSSDNDVSWYTTNEALLRDSASLPYSWPLGTSLEIKPIPLDNIPSGLSPAVWGSVIDSISGIMCIDYFPTIGEASSSISPINYAAQQVYSFVRYANSGSRNYDPTDLMQYLVAMDSAYMFFTWMTRIYGLARLATMQNRYYPRYIIESMYVDFDDVTANLADFRYYINRYAELISAMAVPAGMTLMARHSWMTAGVYLDSTAAKAQSYMFNPTNFYVFTYTGTDNPSGVLQPLPVVTATQIGKVKDIIAFGKQIISPILANEEYGIMSGDILKAFGGDNLYKIAPIAEDYTVIPSYSEEVLSQIENLTVFGHVDTSVNSGSTYPNCSILEHSEVGNSYLYQNIKSTTLDKSEWQQQFGCLQTKLLNMHHDNVTPADTMVASRLAMFGSGVYYVDSDTKQYITAGIYGTEIVEDLRIITIVKDASGQGVTSFTAEISQPSIMYNTEHALSLLGAMMQFDWNPIIPVASNGAGTVESPQFTLEFFAGDVDQYTVLDDQILRKLHETAVLSMFQVPTMARLSTSPIR